ncbi:hypothetical protein KA082_01935, partial [Candidatus Woesebacteria bacterium]|nr:hypothetical protein [Candidatus Woesebacteria bacterium]
SNGGQIAFSTLVISKQSIPTSFWAPVTAPFPYSIMYFSDEDKDEGKGMRIWVSQLEKLYELREFSFTQYLDGLAGPFILHHGTNDEAAPKIWSDEFLLKVDAQNKERAEIAASSESTTSTRLLTPVDYTYYQYPGADHNMQPAANWQQASTRDIEFFKKELTQK